MGMPSVGAAARVAAGVGAAVAARAAVRRWRGRGRAPRTHTVTVARPVADLRVDGELVEPLRQFSERAEVEVSDAPGGRGAQVTARAARAGADVRRELREAKQVLETGQVLRLRPQPEGRRSGGRRWSVPAMDRLLSRGGRR